MKNIYKPYKLNIIITNNAIIKIEEKGRQTLYYGWMKELKWEVINREEFMFCGIRDRIRDEVLYG